MNVDDGDAEAGQTDAGAVSRADSARSDDKRLLGFWSASALVIGRIIGVGIFSTPGSIVGSVGSIGAALTCWVIGALASFCGVRYLLLRQGLQAESHDRSSLSGLNGQPAILEVEAIRFTWQKAIHARTCSPPMCLRRGRFCSAPRQVARSSSAAMSRLPSVSMRSHGSTS